MNRPKVIINAAMSADGKIALPTKKQLRISSDEDMKRVFQLRNDCDGILVGSGAVLSDDPKLTVKEKYVSNPHQPIRIVLDSQCKTPVDSFVVNDWAPTILAIAEQTSCNKSFGNNVELLRCPLKEDGLLDLSFVLTTLFHKEIKTLLVEGGGTVIWQFLKQGFVDELWVYIGPLIVGGKKTSTLADGEGISTIDDLIRLTIKQVKQLGEGILIQYQPVTFNAKNH
ncbi:MAG: 2,5-diamino-6-(ribosylamino)-4(3H)-pyrimidinone 5'-phosphate reductase [Thermoplasmatota archaeon]